MGSTMGRRPDRPESGPQPDPWGTARGDAGRRRARRRMPLAASCAEPLESGDDAPDLGEDQNSASRSRVVIQLQAFFQYPFNLILFCSVLELGPVPTPSPPLFQGAPVRLFRPP